MFLSSFDTEISLFFPFQSLFAKIRNVTISRFATHNLVNKIQLQSINLLAHGDNCCVLMLS